MDNILLFLPTRVLDDRIVALRNRFGREPFAIDAAADALEMTYTDAWVFLRANPSDDAYRIGQENAKFRLIPMDPKAAAIPHWRDRYLPIMQGMGSAFTSNEFAKAAHIPFPTANMLCGLFAQHGILFAEVSNLDTGSVYYRTKAKRRVVRLASG